VPDFDLFGIYYVVLGKVAALVGKHFMVRAVLLGSFSRWEDFEDCQCYQGFKTTGGLQI
jgi:hypothetical protein